MNTQAHISTLNNRCNTLKAEIRKAMLSPSTDDLIVIDMKKTKLRLKDEIAQLQRIAS